MSLDGSRQAIVSKHNLLSVVDRFVFERVLVEPTYPCKRARPSADDHPLANQKIPKKSPAKHASASSALSELELQKLRGALASAKVLLKTKEAEENESRRRVRHRMP